MQFFTAAFAVLLVAILFQVSSQTEINCYTPTGEEGTCVSAKECPFVIDLLTRYRNKIPRFIRNHIREWTCDGERDAKFPICCPKMSQFTLMSQNLKYIDPSGMALLNSVTECGKRNEKIKVQLIVVGNGDDTRISEFPWIVLLKYETEGRPFLCGGSLISDRFVLTAAHCTTASTEIIGVRMGEHNLDTEEDCIMRNRHRRVCLPPYEEFGIEEIRTHPYFERHSNRYDIALIKLNRSVTFAHHIRPICLPIDSESQDIDFDQSFYIAGWGRSNEMEASASPKLLKAVVTRRELDVCRRYYTKDTFTENHICAVSDRKQETCRGDSGGPLFFQHNFNGTIRFVQYGVISFGGLSCGINQDQPGVFASILDMLPWITQNLY